MAQIAALVEAARTLERAVSSMRFAAPVTHVYDPLDYAWAPHAAYLERYGAGSKRVIFLGMNPGPFGMAQTGVPFGDPGIARDWLGLEMAVKRPANEHPKRPVLGFAQPRGEVSGQRLWGAVRDEYVTPARFFSWGFVANYCPLSFMEESGRNRTPDKLPRAERELLFEACDAHLRAVVDALEPRWVIGVGRFAEARARAALEGVDVEVGTILHPSPASPAANKDWIGKVRAQLGELGICE